jgi:hypothetical protein
LGRSRDWQRGSRPRGVLVVYIRRQHPEEALDPPENRRSGIAVHEPATDDEARGRLNCAVKLELTMLTVIDGVDNASVSAYGLARPPLPDRLRRPDRLSGRAKGRSASNRVS